MSGKMAIGMGQGLIILLVSTMTWSAFAADVSRERVTSIVSQIQRADYEGDRPSLKRLHGELLPFVANKDVGVQVRYWRGFALWRRAINGFNDHVDPADLQSDLQTAFDEFNEASRKDPTFADAKIGELSCLGFLTFSIHQQDPTNAKIAEFITQARQLRKDAEVADPENPRLPWVMGPMIWNTPVERGGGQEKAIVGYEKALATIRKQKGSPSDPLAPTWGEPELLMSLAWSNLNRATPDLDAAEKQADAALKLVPYWHYVRDILVPQIREARSKGK